MAKAEALGFPSVNNRAHMAELAVGRGDLDAARHHLAACSRYGAGGLDARAALTWRAAARVARAEGRPHRALGLACDGLQSAFSSGALLLSVDLLDLIVTLLFELGLPEVAARLLGAADHHREVSWVRPFGPGLCRVGAATGQYRSHARPGRVRKSPR